MAAPSATVTPFALAPSLVDPGIIDYSTPQGAKLYHNSVNPLSEEKNDITSDGVLSFLTKLKVCLL